jgi:hypothetical protein
MTERQERPKWPRRPRGGRDEHETARHFVYLISSGTDRMCIGDILSPPKDANGWEIESTKNSPTVQLRAIVRWVVMEHWYEAPTEEPSDQQNEPYDAHPYSSYQYSTSASIESFNIQLEPRGEVSLTSSARLASYVSGCVMNLLPTLQALIPSMQAPSTLPLTVLNERSRGLSIALLLPTFHHLWAHRHVVPWLLRSRELFSEGVGFISGGPGPGACHSLIIVVLTPQLKSSSDGE